jgi:hypothetical protein
VPAPGGTIFSQTNKDIHKVFLSFESSFFFDRILAVTIDVGDDFWHHWRSTLSHLQSTLSPTRILTESSQIEVVVAQNQTQMILIVNAILYLYLLCVCPSFIPRHTKKNKN